MTESESLPAKYVLGNMALANVFKSEGGATLCSIGFACFWRRLEQNFSGTMVGNGAKSSVGAAIEVENPRVRVL